MDIFVDDEMLFHIKNYEQAVTNFNDLYTKMGVKGYSGKPNNFLLHLSGSIEVESKKIIELLISKINEAKGEQNE